MSELDLELLIKALSGEGARAVIAEENPYTAFRGIPQQTSQAALNLAVKDPTSANIREGAAIAAVSGLLEGLLGSKSSEYAAGKHQMYVDALMSGERGDGMSDALWQTARTNKLASQLGFMADAQGRELDIVQTGREELSKKIAGDLADQMIWGQQGGNETGASLKSLHPDSPAYKQTMDIETQIQSLRKEFQREPAFQDFQVAEKGYRALVGAVNDPQSTSDLDFLYGVIQMIEPQGVVREGEQAALRGLQSLPQAWRGQIEKTLSGKPSLRAETRKGLLRLATRRYGEHSRTYGKSRDFYLGEVERRQFPIESIGFLGAPTPAEEVAKELGVNLTEETEAGQSQFGIKAGTFKIISN